MNFLLHRVFAERELGSPVAAIGAMLPDVWRMADKRVRPRGPVSSANEGPLTEVLSGIEHHLAIDRWFHRCEVFVEGERLTADALRATTTGARRLPLFAHVTWEMCLDGALLAEEGLAPTLSAIQSGLDASEEALKAAARLHHFDQVAREAEAAPRFDARVARLCGEIARGPWIEGYQDGLGLADRLAGIRSRLGFEPLSETDRARLAQTLDGLARAARERLPDLFDARQKMLDFAAIRSSA